MRSSSHSAARGMVLSMLCAIVPACNNDHDMGSTSGVMSTGPFDDGTTTGDDGGVGDGLDETGVGGEEVAPCSFSGMQGAFQSVFDGNGDLRIPIAEFEHNVDADTLCRGFPAMAELPIAFNVYTYRPWDASTNWPDDPEFPVTFFVPGNELNTVDDGAQPPDHRSDHYYSHIFEPLSEDGHIVVAVQPASDTTTSNIRRQYLMCAMIWARDAWSESARVSTSASLMGHSRGGAAVTTLVDALFDDDEDGVVDDLPTGTAVEDYEICAAVPIVPKWTDPEGGGEWQTNIDVDNPDAPPLLVLTGARDNDLVAQPVGAYDSFTPEESLVQGGDADPALGVFPKAFVNVYGVTHNAWGGTDPTPSAFTMAPIGLDIANATGPHYTREFLRWNVLGEIDSRQEFVELADPNLLTSALPSAFGMTTDWTDNCDLCPFFDGCVTTTTCSGPPALPSGLVGLGRPVIYGAFTEGALAGGARRFVVDTLERTAPGSGTALGASTLGGDVSVQSPGAGSATWDEAGQLTTGFALNAWNRHQAGAVRLDWGTDGNDLRVVWDLVDDEGMPLPGVGDLGIYTHVSLRIGNLAEGDVTCDQNDPMATLPFDEVDGDLRLLFDLADGAGAIATPWHSIGRLVDPQRPWQFNQASNQAQCDSVQFMHTVRLPLHEFCDEAGLSINKLRGIELRLEDKGVPQRVLVDSIELTRDPTAVGTPLCPQENTGWNCVAASTFHATETSCRTEPTPGCSSIDLEDVDPPWVTTSSGGYRGWPIHMPAGWVEDPQSPTTAELDDITDSCIAACELEWSDNPDVAANCSASSFSSITLRSTGDIGPVQRIPNSQEFGAGLFGTQVLSCSLESDDCCHEFDEDLCATAPTRHTSASVPLSRGEEYVVSFASNSKVTFHTPNASKQLPMAGSAGYSHCPAGAIGTTCPFYLGSASATATSAVTVTDTCPDGSSFQAVVTDLDVELVQPAFGIADAATHSKAMPEGSLFLRGMITVDGATYTVEATNEDVVYVTAAEGWLFAMNMDIAFNAPCGDSTIPVTMEVDLQRQGALESPPSVTIDVPSAVTCPSWVDLDATATDPDSDLATVRWYVDDVLISPTTSRLKFTGPHVLRAVARDARGATRSATKSVTCL